MEARLPASYDTSTTPRLESSTVKWWDEFGDASLNVIVDSAVAGNLDLRLASARVLEVQEMYRITRSSLYPRIQASVDGSRQSTPTNTGATGRFSESIPGFPDRFDVTTYSASLGLAYEIDFWGKARSASRAAIGEFIATAADFQTAQIGVISETISTYFEIRDTRRQLQLSTSNAELLRERVELTEDRYTRGLVTSFELYLVRQSLDDLLAQLPLLESGLYDAKSRLALLLGSLPEGIESLLDDASQPYSDHVQLPVGLPSELLQERPDILASASRLEAARQGIGLARAERFPSLSLTASGGTQSSDLTDLIKTGQNFSVLGGSLIAPIFNAGALNAQVKAAWARYDQAAAAYEKTVLTAFRETSSALVNHDAQMARLKAVQESTESASASADNQLRRYRRGIGDYIALLDAQINAIRAESNLSSAERGLNLARLGVHRALGGAWVSDESELAVNTN